MYEDLTQQRQLSFVEPIEFAKRIVFKLLKLTFSFKLLCVKKCELGGLMAYCTKLKRSLSISGMAGRIWEFGSNCSWTIALTQSNKHSCVAFNSVFSVLKTNGCSFEDIGIVAIS